MPRRQRRRRAEQRRGAGRSLLRVDSRSHGRVQRRLIPGLCVWHPRLQRHPGHAAQPSAKLLGAVGIAAAQPTPAAASDAAAASAASATGAAGRLPPASAVSSPAEPVPAEPAVTEPATAEPAASGLAACGPDADGVLLRQQRRLLHGLGRAGRLPAAPAGQ